MTGLAPAGDREASVGLLGEHAGAEAMFVSGMRRFADVRLGDTIPAAPIEDRSAGWLDRARQLVKRWSGSSDVSLTHCRLPTPASTPRELEARVFARHLDDSGRVDVEVIGRDRGWICAAAVLRVALC